MLLHKALSYIKQNGKFNKINLPRANNFLGFIKNMISEYVVHYYTENFYPPITNWITTLYGILTQVDIEYYITNYKSPSELAFQVSSVILPELGSAYKSKPLIKFNEAIDTSSDQLSIEIYLFDFDIDYVNDLVTYNTQVSYMFPLVKPFMELVYVDTDEFFPSVIPGKLVYNDKQPSIIVFKINLFRYFYYYFRYLQLSDPKDPTTKDPYWFIFINGIVPIVIDHLVNGLLNLNIKVLDYLASDETKLKDIVGKVMQEHAKSATMFSKVDSSNLERYLLDIYSALNNVINNKVTYESFLVNVPLRFTLPLEPLPNLSFTYEPYYSLWWKLNSLVFSEEYYLDNNVRFLGFIKDYIGLKVLLKGYDINREYSISRNLGVILRRNINYLERTNFMEKIYEPKVKNLVKSWLEELKSIVEKM